MSCKGINSFTVWLWQVKTEGLVEEKESIASQVAELQKTREELLTDNRRLAEIVMTMEGESEEAAGMLETLTKERQELRKQCLQLRESGELGRRRGLQVLQLCLSQSLCYRGRLVSWRERAKVVGTRHVQRHEGFGKREIS